MRFRHLLLGAAALLLACAAPAAHSQTYDERESYAATSGQLTAASLTYTHQDPLGAIGATHVFEIKLTGTTTATSITITPYMRGGTAGTATTSSTNGNQVLWVMGTWDYYVVTVSWTGTVTAAVVNVTGTHTVSLAPGASSGTVLASNGRGGVTTASSVAFTNTANNFGSNQQSMANAVITGGSINGTPIGGSTAANVNAALFGASGDTGSTPSDVVYVTSINGTNTPVPAGHPALSTSNIPSGYGCLIVRPYAYSSTYPGEAYCTSNAEVAAHITYLSNNAAHGSESWSQRPSYDNYGNGSFGGCSFNNNVITCGGTVANSGPATASTYVKAGTTFQVSENASIASASTIAPTTSLFHLTGTTTVNLMTPPANFTTTVGAGGTVGCVDIIADGAVPIASGTAVGAFKIGLTMAAGVEYHACYTASTGLWYIK